MGSPEKGNIETGIEKGVGYLIEQFGTKLAGDNAEYRIFMNSPKGKALVKQMIANKIVQILAGGAPLDAKGKPLYKSKSEQIRAGVGQLVSDMGSRMKSGQAVGDVSVNLENNWTDFTGQVGKEVEGMLYDHREDIDEVADGIRENAEQLFADAAKLFS